MAYGTKFDAKQALIESDSFLEGEDWIFRISPEYSSHRCVGRPKERICRSIPCLEYFIIKKFKPGFEVYRQCRIKVTEEAKAPSTREARPARLPHHMRRHLANIDQVPYGSFSVLQEVNRWLVAPLDVRGYELPEKCILDISVGQIFCR